MKVNVEVELPELPPGVAETHGPIQIGDGSKVHGPLYWTRVSSLRWYLLDEGFFFEKGVFYCLPLPKQWSLLDAIDQCVAKNGPLSWENPLLVKLRNGNMGVVTHDMRKWLPRLKFPIRGYDNEGDTSKWTLDGERHITSSGYAIIGPWEGA